MVIPKQLVKDNIDRLFIAYSNIYIEDAIEAIKRSPNAKAVVMQPYESKGSFSATREAIKLHKKLKADQDIPILFSSQGRTVEQYFEYSAQLIDVFDISNTEVNKLINVILDTGRWVLQSQDKHIYAKKDILVVKAPITKLVDKLPVEFATNILRHKRGEPTEAVAIPAPKLIKEEYRNILQDYERKYTGE